MFKFNVMCVLDSQTDGKQRHVSQPSDVEDPSYQPEFKSRPRRLSKHGRWACSSDPDAALGVLSLSVSLSLSHVSVYMYPLGTGMWILRAQETGGKGLGVGDFCKSH